jgi:UDP-N-acetylmuramate--alanine ligase
MVFQPHRYSRTKISWSHLVKVLNGINNIILLPTYSAGEKKTIYDSKFLFKKLTIKNKIYVETIEQVIEVLKLKTDTKSVLLLQGAGDIKNIITILDKNDTK